MHVIVVYNDSEYTNKQIHEWGNFGTVFNRFRIDTIYLHSMDPFMDVDGALLSYDIRKSLLLFVALACSLPRWHLDVWNL